jgi:hypothetical protein
MSKFAGILGVQMPAREVVDEDGFPTGKFQPAGIEKYSVAGNLEELSYSRSISNNVNGEITINSKASVLLYDTLARIFLGTKEEDSAGLPVFLELYGTKWNIESYHIDMPRIEFTLGGVYNGRDV